jgi:hypothetical protein
LGIKIIYMMHPIKLHTIFHSNSSSKTSYFFINEVSQDLLKTLQSVFAIQLGLG